MKLFISALAALSAALGVASQDSLTITVTFPFTTLTATLSQTAQQDQFATSVPTGTPTSLPTNFPPDFPPDFPTDFPSDFPAGFSAGFPTTHQLSASRASPSFTTLKAVPTDTGPSRRADECLDDSTAKQVAADYASLIGAYTEAKANAMLAEDFSGSSDSINVIARYPLGTVTFESKTKFKSEMVGIPAIPLNVTSIDAYSCNVVALRWTQTFGPPSKPQPAAGISTLFVKKQGDKWRFQKIFTEFNSITYFMNLGGHCGLD
ncbi:hypothetical protein Micbo1qcDRAFT_207193 [Microdochium bolleyi]|uniref:NTF2-like domain-containing protein n=1 Tax=Microdochium bolleyi TaxID=196109 RepID=A0A136IUF4_9PEZI|nr:hypothetical protein Micbo1qcDRAFT_207193 [Microdochium bolleyi]